MSSAPSDPVDALEANLWSMWSQFGRSPGCALHQAGGVLWFETPIPVPPYNMVIRTHCDADPGEAIDDVAMHFHARGVPLLWFVHPSARPADLRARLEARGLADVEPVTGMTADLAGLPPVPEPPAGVEIREVTPDQDAAPLLEFVAARWRVPDTARAHLDAIARAFRVGAPGSPNRAWIAVREGQAVAKVFTHDADGHVGLYGMATRPESRGLGLGRLVFLTALADARHRGHTTAVLHSTPKAVRLYEGAGFRPRAAFSLYAEPGTFYA